MFTKIFEKKWLLLVMFISLITSSVRAELVNVGPMDRVYENLLFDGYIKSGDKTLNILSGISDYQQNNNNGYGIWKSNINAANNWKITPTNSWLNAAVINYNFSEDDIYGKPDKIITDRDTSDTNTNDPTTAKFIWAANPGGSEDGENGPEKAYFSYTFNLDAEFFKVNNKLYASANVLADDFFAMSVNGHFVKNGLLDTQISKNPAKNGLGLPVDIPFADWLQVGNNTISIFAYDGYHIEAKDIIKKESISVIPQSGQLTATFTPSLPSITISDAADILGYDHFNWYQLGRFKNEFGQYSATQFINCNSSLQVQSNPAIPCTDPPKNFLLANNFYWGNTPADAEPFYWDEFQSITDKNSFLKYIVDNSFELIDQPSGGTKDFHLDTFLVGINKKDLAGISGWEPLYHLIWDKSNPNGGITFSKDHYLIDKNNIDISVQECMNGDGAKQPSPDNRVYFYEQKSEICFRTQYVSEPPELLLMFIGFSFFYSKIKSYKI